MSVEPRHDFYQTDSAVIVSVYLKGCRAEDVQCDISGEALHLESVSPSPAASLHIDSFWSTVDVRLSSFKVLGSKIEIKLQKVIVGLQWSQLRGVQGEKISTPASIISSAEPSKAPSAAPRARSKWDSFQPDDEEKDENGKAKEGGDGGGGIDDFFKKLYADADDDTRRAMMKSYQESGGTALSTNWNEVGKGKVETKPPEGMEARKW